MNIKKILLSLAAFIVVVLLTLVCTSFYIESVSGGAMDSMVKLSQSEGAAFSDDQLEIVGYHTNLIKGFTVMYTVGLVAGLYAIHLLRVWFIRKQCLKSA